MRALVGSSAPVPCLLAAGCPTAGCPTTGDLAPWPRLLTLLTKQHGDRLEEGPVETSSNGFNFPLS